MRFNRFNENAELNKKSVEKQEPDYMVYSKLLKKPFNSVKEMREAENAYEEEQAKKQAAIEEKKQAELKAKEERSKDAAAVQALANAYLKLIEDNNKVRETLIKSEQDAYDAYKKALDDFSSKNNGYHLTYTHNGNNVEFKVEDAHLTNEAEQLKKQIREMQDFFNNSLPNFFNLDF